ncbi:gliding motility-associated C-terminal domain-containing protein [Pontibacter sp. E15-1]|uniref:Ig-like domain-containing protein n=1 Tax=Pontibacter sp. E15-1 TaxID=2919918 RepID=UPI001F4F1221|nr:gliding motility-associated C-terminal domain-containing protein [Pontibacter sp. E15-1]MCJ8165348.1 gliding motility-associated C-terminal domain-containing protein [Pontibacter sp. E15-1]
MGAGKIVYPIQQSPCTSPEKPKISANGPTNLCSGGSVLLTSTAGSRYKWSNGATTPAITVTRAGTYTVEVTDANGCVGKADEVVVQVADKLKTPTIQYTGQLIVCQEGSLKMTVAAQEGASYVWKRNGVEVADNTNAYTASQAGVYTVELSNFCGAVSSSNRVEFKIQMPLPAFEVKAAGKLVFCKGASVKLSVPLYPDVTYAWFRDGASVPGGTNELLAQEAGTYTASITNKCGTYTSGNSQTVELLPLPNPPAAQQTVGCLQTSVALTATGGSPGMYRWYSEAIGGTAIAGAQDATFTTPQLSASTTYYVALTNGQCESERVAVEALILTKPVAPEIAVNGDIEFCAGGAVELSTEANTTLTYTWLRDGKAYATGSNTLQATESGSYTVQVQNACGTAVSSSRIIVRVRPVPAVPVVQPQASACGPGEVTIAASGGAAGEYRWYESATAATALDASTSGTFTTPFLQSSRTYYVSLVKKGCESARVPVAVTVNPVPQAVASAQDTEINFGESTQLSGSGGTRYSWSPARGLDNPLAASPVATPDQTTRYTLTVQNEEGCADTTSLVVAVRQQLSIPNAFSPNGDGVNDTWEIANINYLPEAKVLVYNRWGNVIFERTNYRSDWNGTYRGAPLPVSTYFYVITVPGGRKFTGYVNIVN